MLALLEEMQQNKIKNIIKKFVTFYALSELESSNERLQIQF